MVALERGRPRPHKMVVGIYGGSFNPVHFGHIRLARLIRQQAHLDEVWFMVSPQNPFKVNQVLLDDELRLQLTRLALRRERGLIASDYEFRLSRPSYTWNTLQSLSRDYPDHSFTLIIGADNWAVFPQWYHADDILAHHRVVVYPRRGYHIDAATLPDGVSLLSTPLFDISSTDIRERIANGRPIRRLVPKAVADIIEQRQLYKP